MADLRSERLTLTSRAVGPPPGTLARVREAVERHPDVRRLLPDDRRRWRTLRVDMVGRPRRSGKGRDFIWPTLYEVTIYDYHGRRAILARIDLNRLSEVVTRISDEEPAPNQEEFEEAVAVLRAQPSPLGDRNWIPIQPMPRLLEVRGVDGRVERTLAVGVLFPDGAHGHTATVIGVNLVHQVIVPLDGMIGAFNLQASWFQQTCGITVNTACSASANNCQLIGGAEPGYHDFDVHDHVTGDLLWQFTIARPAASRVPGRTPAGAGIELLHVDYQGARVLDCAHVPILNVRYLPMPGNSPDDEAGPFRDTQFEEIGFLATGDSTDAPLFPKSGGGPKVHSGFMHCATAPTTILTNGVDPPKNDPNIFYGVAIHFDGDDVVLTSELTTSYYRYVCEWRLCANGDIMPRWGFTATSSSNVCHTHTHHAYWRFQFATDAGQTLAVYETRPAPAQAGQLFAIGNETMSKGADWQGRSWIVDCGPNGWTYRLEPAPRPGQTENLTCQQCKDWIDPVTTMTPGELVRFPIGDVWVLRAEPSEIHDGYIEQSGVFPRGKPAARLDRFSADNAALSTNAVVLWFAGHVEHDQAHDQLAGHYGHWVGPVLRKLP